MPVKSAVRVVEMIEAVAGSTQGLGISDLARRLSIPKSSAWNVAATLVDRRFLERTPTGHLVLGERLFDIARGARFDRSLRAAAHPLMTELMERTRESVFLGVLTRDFEVLLVHKVLGPEVIRYDADVGQTIPAYCTAGGRVLLAALSPGELAQFLKSTRRVRLTERTVTDRGALRRELDEVRRTGVAFNFGERVAGASGISAPVYAGSGRVVAELGLAGPTPRLQARRAELGRLVGDTAARISAALGYRPSPGFHPRGGPNGHPRREASARPTAPGRDARERSGG